MRAVLQRVTHGSVIVDQKTVGEIERGLVIFIGVTKDDTGKDAEYLAEKIANLRVFEDSQGKMNLSVRDCGGEVLVVSQFTILGDCRQGRRPSFSEAAAPVQALDLYQGFIASLERLGVPVATGIFREHMTVEIINDGPVTLLLDSKKTF